jgi:hypothetical protein
MIAASPLASRCIPRVMTGVWLAAFSYRLQPGNRRRGLGEKTMQRDIESKTRSLDVILFYLHLHPRQGIKRSVADCTHPLVQMACHNEGAREFT